MQLYAKPTSRMSKKQVTIFLPVDIATSVRALAAARDKTLQQFLAEAINAELRGRGRGDALTGQIQHMFVRKRQSAKARVASTTAGTRKGAIGIAGWFDLRDVNGLQIACEGLGMTVQALGEAALRAAVRQGTPPTNKRQAA